MEQQQNQLNANVNIKELDDVVCDECGHNVFRDGVLVKYVSPLLTTSGKASYAPIPIWSCAKCGHVNDKMNPLKQTDLKL